MKLAIMQPYIFPYIGYFQLLYESDGFVFFDDVNYINKGYINRNSILNNGISLKITIPLIKASQNKLIKDIYIQNNLDKLLKTISQAYSKAPNYNKIMPLIEDVLLDNNKNLANVAMKSVKLVAEYLDFDRKTWLSSEIDYDREASKEGKLIDICNILGYNKYINPIGGKEIYSKDYFQSKGISLAFIEKQFFSYKQGSANEFIENLSIVDLLMWCEKSDIIEMIRKYKVI